MNKYLLALLILFSSIVNAEMGVPIQLRLKSPDGTYPTDTGLNFKLLVLSPVSSCILREENFTAQSITNGNISLTLGSGSLGTNDPALSLNQVYDNSKAKIGLFCVDANNNVISSGQSYTPSAGDHRVIRIITTINSDDIWANFNMRATPYAIQAESVGGKLAADIVVNDTTTQMNQANLNDLLFDLTRFNNLKGLAVSGVVSTANNFTGTLAGDVGGTQGATSVNKIKGIVVSSSMPMNGDVLQYNGTQYVPVAIPSAPVSSVAGRTGAVVLTNSDISGLGTAAVLNSGIAATNLVQLDGSARIPASTLPTSVLTTASMFSGDVSGTSATISVNRLKGTAISATVPTAGQALVYNGTSWVPTTGFPTFGRSTANQTFSTTTPTAVTSLLFTVVSGLNYKFKFNILYTSTATTTGLKLSLTYPSVTSASAMVRIPNGNDGTGAEYQGTLNASGDIVTSTGTSAANTVHYATVEGIIIPSSSGSMQLLAASEVNGSNIVIRAGSFVETTVIP